MKYPTYEQRKDSNGDAYFWDITSLDAWLFYYPSTSVDRNGKDFLSSNEDPLLEQSEFFVEN